MDSKGLKKFIGFMFIMAALTIAGCGNNNVTENEVGQPDKPTNETKQPATDAPVVPEAPFKISMTIDTGAAEIPAPGNEIELAMEKATNTELDIQILPGPTLVEKLPIMIASEDLPMVMSITPSNLKKTFMLNALKGGVFWEVGPYLKDYPNLSKFDPVILNNISVDGKVYGLPRVRDLARGALLYRKDWLDNVGLQEPETLDQFYEMLKAFTFGDPDKNQKDDTYGFAMAPVRINAFTIFHGAPNNWELKDDGTFVAAATTDPYLEGLKYIKKLYDEKLINQDFAVFTRALWEEAFANGKTGVEFDTTVTGVKMEGNLKKVNPSGEVDMFSILSGSQGKRILAESGTNGIIAFPKKMIKTEADLKRVLKFFDDLTGEEMSTLLRWGLEGKHYNLVNGMAQEIAGSKYIEEVNSPYTLSLGTLPPTVHGIDGEMSPLKRKEIELPLVNVEYAVHDPAIALLSKTAVEKGSQIASIIGDADVKFIMGNMNETQWKAEVQRWRDSGGDQIAKEYAEEHAKIKSMAK